MKGIIKEFLKREDKDESDSDRKQGPREDCRSAGDSLLSEGMLGNSWMVIAIVFGLTLGR